MKLFSCSHQRTTFPMKTGGQKKPHVTCLDCGAEFVYDWSEMRILKSTVVKVVSRAAAVLLIVIGCCCVDGGAACLAVSKC